MIKISRKYAAAFMFAMSAAFFGISIGLGNQPEEGDGQVIPKLVFGVFFLIVAMAIIKGGKKSNPN